MTEHDAPKPETPLESWKEIAAYLQRDARTVRRWEQAEGLPVHRHHHRARSSVYAYPSELDAWRAGRKPEGRSADEGRLPARSTRLAAAAAVLLMTLLSAGGGRFMTPAEVTAASILSEPARKVVTSDTWNYAAGSVSADGRYLPYVDKRYDLALQDLVEGTDRTIVRAGEPEKGFPAQAAVSRDSRQVAYSWCFAAGPEMTRVCELWTLALHDPDGSRRKLGGNTETFLTPLDWTPDGSSIVVAIGQSHTERIGLADATTGALRPLKSLGWRGAERAGVSPDGRDIGLDGHLGDAEDDRDVFVLAADGSRETVAVRHPARDLFVGWAPDGGHLLFASDRRGRMELWAQPWANRRPYGEPRPLAVVPPGRLLGFSASGTLFTQEFVANRTIEVVAMDLASGQPTEAPAKLMSIGNYTSPAWSPDGSALAYVTSRDGKRLVGIRDLERDTTRELDAGSLEMMQGLTWSPDGRSLVVSAARQRHYGIYRIDVHDGSISPLVVPIDSSDQLSYEGFFWSPDGRRLYYHSQNGRIHERDESSGAIRELVRGQFGPISVSPDGRWIATSRTGGSEAPVALVLVSIATGQVRELLELQPGEAISNVAMPWTPDGDAVLMRKMRAGSGSELWIVPADGKTARKLDFDANRISEAAWGKMRLHPDGRRLAYVTGWNRAEVWALENLTAAIGR